MFQKTFQITGPLPRLEDMETKYKQTGKSPTEIIRGKSGIKATVLGKIKDDYLYISKNGYHGVGITLKDEGGTCLILVGQCIPSRVVAWFRNRAGLLLIPLFPMIWGKQKQFYEEVEAFIRSNYQVESTLDVNDLNYFGMFKKK